MHPTGTRTELFAYLVRGVAELATSGGVQRVMAGTLIVIPGGERHVSLQAVGGIDVALVEFSPERR